MIVCYNLNYDCALEYNLDFFGLFIINDSEKEHEIVCYSAAIDFLIDQELLSPLIIDNKGDLPYKMGHLGRLQLQLVALSDDGFWLVHMNYDIECF